MCILYKNIIRMCDERKVSPSKAFTDAGLARSTVTELKMGRTKTLSANNLDKLSKYFGVSINELLGNEKSAADKSDTLSSLEFIIRNMPEEKQKALLELLTSEAK